MNYQNIRKSVNIEFPNAFPHFLASLASVTILQNLLIQKFVYHLIQFIAISKTQCQLLKIVESNRLMRTNCANNLINELACEQICYYAIISLFKIIKPFLTLFLDLILLINYTIWSTLCLVKSAYSSLQAGFVLTRFKSK